jgi:hypothetical protein
MYLTLKTNPNFATFPNEQKATKMNQKYGNTLSGGRVKRIYMITLDLWNLGSKFFHFLLILV